MLELLWSMTFRPYVTLFLLGFLALSSLEQGWLRTVIWLVSGYLVAFLAEYCSTQVNGIPFGWYVYNYNALENDLMVMGVPFFDSLSFSFLSYVSFSFAQFFMSTFWFDRHDVQRVTPRRVRNSAFVLLLGTTLMVVIDIIVDPLAHLGRYWFLGDIYYYPDPGHHFSVPLANYAGWFAVGWVVIFLNQRIDAALSTLEQKRGKPVQLRHLPFKGVFAPLFWAGIVLFQLGVTYWLGWSGVIEPEATTLGDANLITMVRLQAYTGTFIVVPILLLALAHLLRPAGRAQRADLQEWLEEYPCAKLQQRN